MIFIQNKYTNWYYNIINKSINRNLSSRRQAKLILGYVELHHIKPKSLGGDDSKQNTVYLTAKEHFVCHNLLTRMLADKKQTAKMKKALEMMTLTNKSHDRYSLCARQYEKIRNDASIAHSLLLTGKYGRKHSEDTRKLISSKRIGSPGTFTGKKHSESSLTKMRGARPNFVPHNKGKRGEHSSGAAKTWSILNTSTGETHIVLSLNRWAVENNYNPNTVGDYVRKKSGKFKIFLITKVSKT